MKHKNRLLALGMALSLSLALVVPAFAADDNSDGYDDTSGAYVGGQTITVADAKQGTLKTYKDTEGQAVPFVGIIKPTQIKATIPTQVVFDLDPTLDVVNDWNTIKTTAKKDINYAQVTNPSNLKILNNSTVPMYVYVSKVKATNAVLTNIGTAEGLKDAKSILFGITSAAENTTGVDAIAGVDHWIKPASANDDAVRISDSKHYVLNQTGGTGNGTTTSKYKSVPAVSADGVTPGELQLWVNAISINGWNSDDVFTVMPTIIVSAKDPDVTTTYTANAIT